VKIELMVHLELGDGDVRIYSLTTERPYSRTPMAGELVMLNDGDEDLCGTSVESVSWDNDGTATLEFELEDSPDFVNEAWLIAAGYERIDADAFDDEDEEDDSEP
jgi:hypothetical protein